VTATVPGSAASASGTAPRTALVLGGGGIAGIAWEVGVLSRLLELGVPLDDADLVVGTSAGSVVGAELRRGGVPAGYLEQLEPAPDQPAATLDVEAFQTAVAQAVAGATDEQEARARLGALARRVPVPADGPELVAAMRGRFGEDAPWPDGDLVVCTVDATTGAFRVLGREDGVPLPVAVAASCSVPLVWPTVDVAGAATMDGGTRSGTNADVADAAERVLVLSCGPEPETSPLGPSLPRVVRARRAAGRAVHVVEADEDALRAFALGSLSPASRRPAAEAGRRQADAVADAVRAFWTDDGAPVGPR